MLADPDITFADVCGHLGVGRSTLYRHLHTGGWDRETVSKMMMQALEDDMDARPDLYRRLAES